MPRAKVPVKKAVKRKATSAYILPPPLSPGVIVTDLSKNKWQIGSSVGQGGFGLIYLASTNIEKPPSDDCEYAIKFEPISNGPLYCEMHFYIRAAKHDSVESFRSSRKLRYLGVPPYLSSGKHIYNSVEYRFLVMPRFGTDLQTLFERSNRRFSVQTVCKLALRLLDDLEFIHGAGFTHNDVKASNILLGYQPRSAKTDSIYLVDYGLARQFLVGNKHHAYKEDPRKAHDGTIEFTSRDAHRGVVPSRRGDVEILGYCLLQWLCGVLPWENDLENKDYVRDSKIGYMADIPALLDVCFDKTNSAKGLMEKYLKYISDLEYEEEPPYDKLRSLFRKELGRSNEWTLDLTTTGQKSSPAKMSKFKHRKTHDDSIYDFSSGNEFETPELIHKERKVNKDVNQNATVGAKALPKSKEKDLVPTRKFVTKSKNKAIKRLSVATKGPLPTRPVTGKTHRVQSPLKPSTSGLRKSPRSTIPSPKARFKKPAPSAKITNGLSGNATSLTPIEIAGKRARRSLTRVETAVQTSPSLLKSH